MDDMLSEFLTETTESIDEVDVELVQLEKDPNNPELLANIFRLVHTIKGTCGFLGLPRLERVAHSAENILGKVRDGDLIITGDIVTLILESLDQIKYLLAELEANQVEPDGNDQGLIDRLDAVAAGREPEPAEAPSTLPEVAEERELKEGEVSLEELERVFQDTPAPDTSASVEPERELKEGEVSLDELERIFQETEALVDAPQAAEEAPVEPAAPEAPPAASIPAPAEAKGPAKSPESSVANSTIRVNVELLENLMTTVSELVLTRNQLMQLLRVQENQDSDFAVPLQRLSHVTTDLQEAVMKTRMQPIGNAWAKLPRIIRDLAKDLNKKINLEMIGAETELDRQVLELIKDPLTHMVRNSADHGLEDTAGRIAAGKSEVGRVILEAFHEGGHIIVQIRDDGAGINTERVKEKVISNGLASEIELAGMSDQQIVRFIFKPGFSTAEKVTSVSGRGVGMDVVRTNIEKIGGTVDVTSVQGKGSTFTIKIPLTLAIVSSLIVGCGNEKFAMPQISVMELVRASSDTEHRIEKLNDKSVLRLRNRLLPLVDLRQILNIEEAVSDTSAEDAAAEEKGRGPAAINMLNKLRGRSRDDESFIVVSHVGQYQFGIVVDQVFDTEEIVVKPVSPLLKEISVFSGNTILGDGNVIMILDPNGIAAHIGDTTMVDEDAADANTTATNVDSDQRALLVFRAGGNEPKAVPLALVDRLEDFTMSSLEESNGEIVVQYRGHLMPLVNVEGATRNEEKERQPVLVFSDRGRSMGVMVDEIVDIVESTLALEIETSESGVIGNAIVDGNATGILDVSHYLLKCYGDWFENGHAQPKVTATSPSEKVLLMAENQFLRVMLDSYISSIGYDISTVTSLAEARELYDADVRFSTVLVDISLDEGGFAFAEALSSEPGWSDATFVALGSDASPEEVERMGQSAFEHYAEKGNRQALRQVLDDLQGNESVAA